MSLNDFANSLKLSIGVHVKLGPPLIGYSKLSKDTVKYPYWSLDTSSFDTEVQRLFNDGKVCLNHAITPDSIIMTIDQAEKYITHPDSKAVTDYDEWSKIEDDIQNIFRNESDISESSDSPVNYIYYTPVADGKATYKVVKATKASVWLELRKFGDGYMDRHLGVEHKMSMNDFLRVSMFKKPKLAFRMSPFR